MMAGHGPDQGAVGGPARHIPVLLAEVLGALAPKPGDRIIDGTFGAGGYSRALLEAGASVIALDRDPSAIAAGRVMEAESNGRLRLVETAFSRLDEAVQEPVDGVVLDVGVSSMQLDEAGRGFSFRHEGPLDMRMSMDGPSAADVVNGSSYAELARIFAVLGEERHAGRIARMIEKRRQARPFTTTLQLADAIETLVGRKPGDRIHPATRVFQGLRIFVNDELGELAAALAAAERVLKPGGRLAVVSFHSLEDRIVKRFLAERSALPTASRHMPLPEGEAPTFSKPDKAMAAGDEETSANPRARSARLRAATRTDAPARGAFELPSIPRLTTR
jgi:16S rRNA (cytosine1402-N4)-methyltransferase